ncbi:MAG: twin-arginine translocase subunit TatC [Bacteriovoracaceae bacterium]|nr:twin-arginine translocase subunit TatC [Bacteroidota bacterium]
MPNDQPHTTEREMGFLDHLEELRSRILKAVLAVLAVSIVAAFFSDFLVKQVLLGPLLAVGLKPQVLKPYGIMLTYMQVVLVMGIIGAMPIILYQLWKFVAPGLMPNERKYASGIVFFTTFCFISGISFAYFILVPTALTFFSTFGTDVFELNIAIDEYISFMLSLILGAGLVFELPMITFFLSKIGIVTPKMMRKYRRHAIIGILIISAVVTPTPDILTQSLLAAPMILLYELSIFISSFAQRTKTRESA